MTNVQLNRPNPSNVNISPSELTAESIKHDILDHLYYSQARLPEIATRNDWYMSLALTVRDRLLDHWIATARTVMKSDVRVVSYLSAEFLIGPQLGNNLINLGIYDQTRQATEELGLNLDSLLDQEEEPGLGNGGLGRLDAERWEVRAELRADEVFGGEIDDRALLVGEHRARRVDPAMEQAVAHRVREREVVVVLRCDAGKLRELDVQLLEQIVGESP